MHVYRITLAKYGSKLIASGRAARWNGNDIEVLYTASSRALACLENAVHRDQIGLMGLFNIITIDCPNDIKIKTVRLNDLPTSWTEYDQMYLTQQIGEKWIRENQSAILKVPSSIIEEEANFLINPQHVDFKFIHVIKTEPFIFDKRIKR